MIVEGNGLDWKGKERRGEESNRKWGGEQGKRSWKAAYLDELDELRG